MAARRAARGVGVTDETSRQWCRTVGQPDAKALRRRRPRPADTGPRAEVFLTSPGAPPDVWRAVAQEGHVLDLLGHRRRNQRAATPCLRQWLQGVQSVPRVLSTDQLASAGAAKREMLPSVAPRHPQGLNHRAEHSQQPSRARGGGGAARLRGTPSASLPPTAPSPRTAAPVATA